MKKKLFVLISLLLLLNLFLFAETLSKEFNLYFIKSGETSFNITNSAHTSELDKIDFSIWDESKATNTDGTINYPVAEFGIIWEIYRGTSYSIRLDFNSSLDLTGDSMLISDNGNKANYYAEATIEGQTGTISNKEYLDDQTSNSALDTSAAGIELVENSKGEYEMANGKALVKLTMIPKESEGKIYFMDGDYTGYVILSLETY